MNLIQKPTARAYYEKCLAENGELAKYGLDSVWQKMKNFRKSYSKANDWRHSTGAGLSEENTEQTIKGQLTSNVTYRSKSNAYSILADHLNKMCPLWDTLDEIFSQKVNLTPVAIYESENHAFKSDVNDLNDAELIIDDTVDLDFIDDNETTFSSVASANENQNAFEVLSQSGTSQNCSYQSDSQFTMKDRLQKKPRANPNNSTALLYEISKMRSEATQKKLDLEARKLDLEEKKMERDFEIRKLEAEARKLEAENIRLQLTLRSSVNDK